MKTRQLFSGNRNKLIKFFNTLACPTTRMRFRDCCWKWNYLNKYTCMDEEWRPEGAMNSFRITSSFPLAFCCCSENGTETLLSGALPGSCRPVSNKHAFNSKQRNYTTDPKDFIRFLETAKPFKLRTRLRFKKPTGNVHFPDESNRLLLNVPVVRRLRCTRIVLANR